ncbi:MAG: hypothetical protein GX074_00185 [Erysipelothrix sp.]|nr:hypothetical protein [Erysipelothrix sp.]
MKKRIWYILLILIIIAGGLILVLNQTAFSSFMFDVESNMSSEDMNNLYDLFNAATWKQYRMIVITAIIGIIGIKTVSSITERNEGENQ